MRRWAGPSVSGGRPIGHVSAGRRQIKHEKRALARAGAAATAPPARLGTACGVRVGLGRATAHTGGMGARPGRGLAGETDRGNLLAGRVRRGPAGAPRGRCRPARRRPAGSWPRPGDGTGCRCAPSIRLIRCGKGRWQARAGNAGRGDWPSRRTRRRRCQGRALTRGRWDSRLCRPLSGSGAGQARRQMRNRHAEGLPVQIRAAWLARRSGRVNRSVPSRRWPRTNRARASGLRLIPASAWAVSGMA